MNQVTPLQNAIIISSIIGTIMSEYNPRNPKENTKSINIIKARIKKFMFSRSRTNKIDFLKSIKIADIVWKDAVNHFAQKKMTIEAVSTILGLYNLYEEELEKCLTVTEMIGFCKANIFKYQYRLENKGQKESDIKKIRTYEEYLKLLTKLDDAGYFLDTVSMALEKSMLRFRYR